MGRSRTEARIGGVLVALLAGVAGCTVLNAPTPVAPPPGEDGPVVEDCDNGVDDDGDDLDDCSDPDCPVDKACGEHCDNDRDDDVDGLPDCADPECSGDPACLEESRSACLDRRDNDLDGLIDCRDPVCFPWLHCFPAAPIVADEPCLRGRPAVRVRDGFEGAEVDEEVWEVFADDPRGRLVIHDGMLAPSIASRGLFTVAARQTVRVGPDQPFALEADFLADPECSQCDARVMLQPAEGWDELPDHNEDGVPDTETSIGVYIGRTGTETLVGCTYGGAPLGDEEYIKPGIEWGARHRVELAMNPAVGMSVRVGGQEVCATSEVLTNLPEVRLLVSMRTGDRDVAPPIALDTVDLRVAEQLPPPSCDGVRRPLWDEDVCGWADPGGTGIGSAAVLELEGRQHAWFVQGPDDPDRAGVRLATSADGRTGWGRSEEVTLDGRPTDTVTAIGAMIHRTDEDVLQGWVLVDNSEGPTGSSHPCEELADWPQRPVMIQASPEAPELWRFSERGVGYDSCPAGLVLALGVPEAVVFEDGVYRGWLTASVWASGRSAVYAAASRDGASWSITDPPVLLAGDSTQWDNAGVRRPVVVRAYGYLVMAYSSAPFGVPAAVGLAVSADGVSWDRHRDNPLVSPWEDGFDAGGMSPVGLGWSDEQLALWYLGQAPRTSACPALDSSREVSMLGLARLPFGGAAQ